MAIADANVDGNAASGGMSAELPASTASTVDAERLRAGMVRPVFHRIRAVYMP